MRLARLLPALLLFAVLCAPLARIHAQQALRFEGVIRDDESLHPLPEVTVELLDRNSRRLRSTATDSSGGFSFEVARQGGYRFRATRLGYQSTTSPVLWTDNHRFLGVDLRMHRRAVLLAPLEVVAWDAASNPILEGFAARRQSGLGHFITRDDILARQPTLLSDMLTRVPGLRLESAGTGTRRIAVFRRSSGPRACPVQVFVDGLLQNPPAGWGAGDDVAIDDLVPPGSVEGIEVYGGMSSIPAEFITPEARCGVIAIWTRRGG